MESQNFVQERTLLHDMWVGLEGPANQGVHVRNLLLFILGLMGLYFELPKIHEYNYCGKKNQNYTDISMPMQPDHTLRNNTPVVEQYEEFSKQVQDYE